MARRIGYSAALIICLIATCLAPFLHAAKVITTLEPLLASTKSGGVIFQIERIPTSDPEVYLSNVTCALGVFGQEIRYEVASGSVFGNPKKMLFVRTYKTDDEGFMRPWQNDDYRWHPFTAGDPDSRRQSIELPDQNCHKATHVETSIVRGERVVPATVRCVTAACR